MPANITKWGTTAAVVSATGVGITATGASAAILATGGAAALIIAVIALIDALDDGD